MTRAMLLPSNWRRLDGPVHESHRIHGQLITCAGCGELTWAARADGPALEFWTVERYPDCCYCPRCRKRAAAKPEKTTKPAPKRPNLRKGQYTFEMGCAVLIGNERGMVTDRRMSGGNVKYVVLMECGETRIRQAREMKRA